MKLNKEINDVDVRNKKEMMAYLTGDILNGLDDIINNELCVLSLINEDDGIHTSCVLCGITEDEIHTNCVMMASQGARADPVAGREESGESAESSIALANAGNALIWWRSVKRVYEPREITWVEFQREFDDKYRPKMYQDKKRMEFLNLVQGDEQIVAEYELRFAALAKYAPEAVVGELDKVIAGGQLSLRVALLVGGDMSDSVGD
ncbi:UNVERIFIED_CONTAM: hypothetical protein Scaly_2731000 [Sesamum calycinum]|uniref:Retrotransposon gag domain-containing protein n=1 Tax=Sesamum calycinum TaxID=2727403 RepID=A0AAW2J1Z5_9LAMI